jgi:hypothetical protein
MSGPPFPAVPNRYCGVWTRKLLKTPELHDETTLVQWMQTPHWHADVRVPPAARALDAGVELLATQQGFAGMTSVDRQDGGETCTWHRLVDFQRPGPDPDTGFTSFESPDRLIETGIHREYHEVWERLPGSTGRCVALEMLASPGQVARSFFLVAGKYAMRVRSRAADWPAGTAPLAELVRDRAPGWQALLDFEISFGVLDGGRFQIRHSTLPALEGSNEACVLRRDGKREAVLRATSGETRWRVLDWDAEGLTLA